MEPHGDLPQGLQIMFGGPPPPDSESGPYRKIEMHPPEVMALEMLASIGYARLVNDETKIMPDAMAFANAALQSRSNGGIDALLAATKDLFIAVAARKGAPEYPAEALAATMSIVAEMVNIMDACDPEEDEEGDGDDERPDTNPTI